MTLNFVLMSSIFVLSLVGLLLIDIKLRSAALEEAKNRMEEHKND